MARPWFVVQTLEARPYSTPLAQATAWSSSVKRCTVMTGPKISSWTSSSSWSHVGDHRGGEEEAAVADPLAAGHDVGVVRGAGQMPWHPVQLVGGC